MTATTAEALTGERRRRIVLIPPREKPLPDGSICTRSPCIGTILCSGFLLSGPQDILGNRIRVLSSAAAALLEESDGRRRRRPVFRYRRPCIPCKIDLRRCIIPCAQEEDGLWNVVGASAGGHVQKTPGSVLLAWTCECHLTRSGAGAMRRSFEQFWDRKDPAGTFLSWSLIIDNLCMYLNDFKALDAWMTDSTRLRTSLLLPPRRSKPCGGEPAGVCI